MKQHVRASNTLIVSCMAAVVLSAAASCASVHSQREASSLREWVMRASRPLSGVEPTANVGELAPLDAIVGDAHVVGMGETAHHMRELALIRARAMQYLVERRGARALAMETGMAEAERLNRWILGVATVADFAEGMPFANDGSYLEVRDALAWLREHNAKVPALQRVRFYGIDMARGGGALDPVLAEVWSYLAVVDSETAVREKTVIQPISTRLGIGRPTSAQARYDSLSAATRTALDAGLARIASTMDAKRRAYTAQSSTDEYARARQLVEVARQTVYMMKLPPTSAARDSALAANVRWIAERERDRGIVIVWAANAHVQRAAIDIPGVTRAPAKSMGQYLHEVFGRDYVAIGTAVGAVEGDTAQLKVGSVDAVLGLAAAPVYLIDLRNARTSGEADAWLDSPHPMRFIPPLYLSVVPRQAFDGLFFFAKITAGRRVED
ncbi:MAG: erythromycin esterase family protein [Gemmatimonadaceae bacterium]